MSSSVTSQVYSCIRDDDYNAAIDILKFHAQAKLGDFPRSRPLLSLLAYCCYHNQEYNRASEFYETLTELCPESEEYHVNYVQSLVKGGSYLDASVAAFSLMSSSMHSQRLKLLQAQAEMEQGMMSESSKTLSKCAEDDPETIIALSTLAFRQGTFDKALATYKSARHIMSSNQRMLTYCIALCHYRLREYDASLELIEEIIDTTRVKNQNSNDTFVKEALNLKAVLLYEMKQYAAAKTVTTLFDEDLDTVTAHNHAIINVAEDPSAGIQKLGALLSQQSLPPETLGNLLTLYTSHGQDILAAEVFEANKHLAGDLLRPEMYAYFEAVSLSLTCPDDAIVMLEAQRAHHIHNLSVGKQSISGKAKVVSARPATASRHNASRPTAIAEKKEHSLSNKDFEYILDSYMPLLCLQAKIYWERREYSMVEHLLRDNVDFCSDQDAWLMNMGHVMFAQGDKFEASVTYYERLLERYARADLFKMPAVALANLCVAYVLIEQNETAEELIKTIEREEEELAAMENSGGQIYHSCIVNLCIGSLYCERKNYAFGIDRICKSLAPFEKNVCSDTWFYAKKSLLAFALSLSNQSAIIKDILFRDLLQFLEEMEPYGKVIPTEINEAEVTIASEARQLKNMFILLAHDM
ncbi:hypothetical protein ACHAXH_007459 [Discostella pseudostelligera]